jgi:poly-gamma-glutamate synthesis protein (capsule biosynthesis protein)
MVAGHGPHFLRGIEIYNGKPIFYSLGNFIFQNETVQRVPPPGYSYYHLGDDSTPGDWGLSRSGGGEFGFAADPVFYRSAVPVVEFEGGRLREIRLYPIDLGFKQPMSQRGRPVLAEGQVAQEILQWLQDVSKPFGTEIAIEGEVGVIRQ